MTSATSRISDLLRASAALTACLIVGASATAYAAAPADASASVRVNYHDLNLATEQGTQILYGRIVAAAQACEAQAISHAVRAVNSPRLAATHSAHQRQG